MLIINRVTKSFLKVLKFQATNDNSSLDSKTKRAFKKNKQTKKKHLLHSSDWSWDDCAGMAYVTGMCSDVSTGVNNVSYRLVNISDSDFPLS